MRYILALLCPPIAILRAGKPVQATLAGLAVVAASLTWSSGLGVMIAAVVLMWSVRVVGAHYATEELASFLRLCHADRCRR